ncbi:MAG: SMC-Scp complex subunit ScpB [Planctomycetota bacterium]
MAPTPDPPFEHEPQQGISLDALAQAYAQAMGAATGRSSLAPSAPCDSPDAALGDSSGEPPERAPGVIPFTAGKGLADEIPAESEAAGDADDTGPVGPLTVLEALLFVGDRSGESLPPERAAEVMRGVEPGDVAGMVAELNERYRQEGRPYHIVHEGAGYRMTLRPDFHALRRVFYGKVREARLSQAAIDTLAIVAYQQPIGAEQVSKLRGKPSGHVLSQLVHRQLLRIERTAGNRTSMYRTTDRFLRLFHLDSLEDLPRD